MSLALYRKYRPGRFAEVVGQEHVTGPLQTALRTDRLHHAYLFSGPRGCGKTSSARILARSLNCVQGPTPDPCGECASCVELAPNGPGSLDVIEIDAASHNGVDDARDLRDRAIFAPVRDRFKVYIIDEAHMITKEAFNALLKLVEEPPDFVTFVFATTEPEKVLGTIRSRTHHYPFRLMPRTDLTALLSRVAESEGVPVDPGALSLVVRAAAGSARDGLSILDQVVASSGPDGVTREGAADLLGVTPDSLLDELVDAFAADDAATVFTVVDAVLSRGNDPHVFARDVLDRLRDLLVLDAVPDAGERGLVDCPPEQVHRMVRQAAAMGRARLSRAADVLADGLVEMRGKTAPRLLLELICARVLLPAASADPAGLLERLERLERRLEIGAPASAAPPATPPSVAGPAHAPHPAPAAPAAAPAAAAPAPRAQAAPAAPAPARPAAAAWPTTTVPGGAPATRGRGPDGPAPAGAPGPSAPPAAPPAGAEGGEPVAAGLDAARVRRAWDDVLTALSGMKKMAWVAARNAVVLDVTDGEIRLGFRQVGPMKGLQGGANTDYLQDALEKVLGVRPAIRCVLSDEHGAPAPGGQAPAGRAEAAPAPDDGFAPGDEPVADDPDAPPPPVVRGDEAALRLVEQQLGGRVVGTSEP